MMPYLLRKFSLFLLFCILFQYIYSQSNETLEKFQRPPLRIAYTQEKIELDGILNEAIWAQTGVADNYVQYFPQDTVFSSEKSEVRLVYDEDNLYVGVKCYSTVGDDWLISSLRRDYRGPNNDGITIVIDPFGNQNNAFVFGLNPHGVRREALLSNGGRERGDFNLSWDQVWDAETKIHEGEKYWTGEMLIPFKTLRYQKGKGNWKMNSYRLDTQTNERSSWQRIPRNMSIITLGFMGDLVFEEPLKKPGANISIIPYTLGSSTKNFVEGGERNSELEFGGDMKVAVTPSLNLDLTFNPDFSQVEVDQQVTDLDRFEIFFPERRQFFLENSDLFAQYGFQRIRPFFSRRIGIAYDEEEAKFVQNRIWAGARLSGQLTDKWRIGLLNMQTAKDESIGLASTNFGMASLQYQVLPRSNISGFLVNKQTTANEGGNEFNRTAGVDFNHSSLDNRWRAKTFLHITDDHDTDSISVAHGGQLGYNGRDFGFIWDHQYVSKGYNAEVGFVPRTGYIAGSVGAEYNIWMTDKPIIRQGPGAELSYTYDLNEEEITDRQLSFRWQLRFRNQSIINVAYENQFTKLTFDFDPTATGVETLPTGSEYNNHGLSVFYEPDRRKKLYFSGLMYVGGYFDGDRYGLNGNLTYQFQPYGNLGVNTSVNIIQRPSETAELFLIGPRLDITFTRKIFWTTFVQFNTQSNRFDVNTRLQWRFKPVSDLFIVYTDNYNTQGWEVRNRGIVLKLTYWLNI